MKMKKFFKSRKHNNFFVIVLSCILIFGAIFGAMAMINNEEKTTKVVNSSYAIGGLTENGVYKETKASIYTKNAFDCNDLTTTLAFDNNITYRIFFYDFDNNFLSSTGKLVASYKEEIPFKAKQCRIVITPNADEKISWYEISKYSKQLKIQVSKTQFNTYEDKVDKCAVDLFQVENTLLGKYIGNSCVVGSQYELSTTNTELIGMSKFLNVSEYSKLTIKSYNGTFPTYKYMFVDQIGIVVSTDTMVAQKVVDGVAIMTIDVPQNANEFTFTYQVGVSYKLLGE